MRSIACGSQNDGRFFHGIFVVKFQTKHAVLGLPVVGDADILDAEALLCQQGGDMGQSPGLVRNVELVSYPLIRELQIRMQN